MLILEDWLSVKSPSHPAAPVGLLSIDSNDYLWSSRVTKIRDRSNFFTKTLRTIICHSKIRKHIIFINHRNITSKCISKKLRIACGQSKFRLENSFLKQFLTILKNYCIPTQFIILTRINQAFGWTLN